MNHQASSPPKNRRRVTNINPNLKISDIAKAAEFVIPVVQRPNDRIRLQNPTKAYHFRCEGQIENGQLSGANVEWKANFDKPIEQLLYPSLQRFKQKGSEEKRKNYQNFSHHCSNSSKPKTNQVDEKVNYAGPIVDAGHAWDEQKMFVHAPTWSAAIAAGDKNQNKDDDDDDELENFIDVEGEAYLRSQLKLGYLENFSTRVSYEDPEISLLAGSPARAIKRKGALQRVPALNVMGPEMLYGSLIRHRNKSAEEIDLSIKLNDLNFKEKEKQVFIQQKRILGPSIPKQQDHMLDGLLYYRMKNERNQIEAQEKHNMELTRMTTYSNPNAHKIYNNKFTQQIRRSSTVGLNNMSIKEMTVLKNEDPELISSQQLKTLQNIEEINFSRVNRAKTSKQIGLYKDAEEKLKLREKTPQTSRSRQIHKSPHKAKREAQDALLLLQLDAGVLPEKFVRHNSDVQTLVIDLSNYGIGDTRGLCLGKCLTPLEHLESIGLSDNRLTHKSLPTIVNNLSVKSLLHMDLSFNALHEQGCKAISDFFKSKTCLRYLDISNSGVQCSDIRAICQSLSVAQQEVEEMNLSCNKIAADGAEAICQYLSGRFATVQILDLSWNNIGEPGAAAFANSMCYARSLTHLKLASNSLNDSGVQLLAASLSQSKSIVDVDLSQNGASDRACFVIAKVLRSHPSMKRLDLSLNPLGEAGARAIFRVILKGMSCFIAMRDCSYKEDIHVFNSNNAGIMSPYALDMAVPYNQAVLEQLILKVTNDPQNCSIVSLSYKENPKASESSINLVVGSNNMLVLKSTGVEWIPPDAGIIKIVFKQSEFIPSEKHVIDESALDVMNKIVIYGRSDDDRRNWIRLLSQDAYFTTEQAQRTINLYTEKNILGNGGITKLDIVKFLWKHLVDTHNMFDFLCSNTDIKERRELIYAISLQRYKFNWSNPTASWRINLADRTDRAIMMSLVAINSLESDFSRTSSGRGDTSQHANWNNFRNERYARTGEETLEFIFDKAFLEDLPASGTLQFDYVSTTRPSLSGSVSVITDEQLDDFLAQLGLSSRKKISASNSAFYLLDLQLASTKYYFNVEHLITILEAFVDEWRIQSRVIVCMFSRIKDLHRMDIVLRNLNTNAQNEVVNRLGYLNVMCPLKISFDYVISLKHNDNRRILVDLMELASMESAAQISEDPTTEVPIQTMYGAYTRALNDVRSETVRITFADFGVVTNQVNWNFRRDQMSHFLVGTQPLEESTYQIVRMYKELEEAGALSIGPIDLQYSGFKKANKSNNTMSRAAASNTKMLKAMRNSKSSGDK